MELVVVAIRDAKAEMFGNPFYSTTVGSAVRGFDDEVNRAHEENGMFRHPEDYALWHIGSYDNRTGKFTLLEYPALLIQGDQVKKGQLHSISKV